MKSLLDSKRRAFLIFLTWLPFLLFLSPSIVLGEVLILPQDDLTKAVGEGLLTRSWMPKADQPGDFMILPFFEVDTNHMNGSTTLYALRNIRDQAIEVEILYADLRGTVTVRRLVQLPARQTLTVNLRDVDGLWVDEHGFARGMVMFLTNSFSDGRSMVGDFFRVNQEQNHATGDRLISLNELCDMGEARFLDFGEGTHLRILISQPQGMDLTRPTFKVTPIREDGTALGSSTVYTDQVLLELDADTFTKESFGTLVFDFSNGRGGYVFAEYSSEGRFSVGLNSACLELEKLP